MGAPSTAVATGETMGFISSLPMLPAPPTGPSAQLQFVPQAQLQPTQYMMQTAAGLVPQGLVPHQSTQLQHRLMPQLPATVPTILTTHYDLDSEFSCITCLKKTTTYYFKTHFGIFRFIILVLSFCVMAKNEDD
jgi:hypothetical protein